MHLLVRTDAGEAVGYGHAMRCLALTQAWRDAGGEATLLLAAPAPGMEERYEVEGVTITHHHFTPGSPEDADATAALSRDCIVADGYAFEGDFQRRLKMTGARLLVLDDHGHAKSYAADFVLNPSVFDDEAGLYRDRSENTHLLLGPSYALLRREFLRLRRAASVPARVRRVLVTFGGSDVHNVTSEIMKTLEPYAGEDLEIIVAIGGANPHGAALEAIAAQSGVRFDLRRDIRQMAELMTTIDLAISASGSTAWELACLGVPTIALVLAENQEAIGRELQTRGISSVVADAGPSLTAAIDSLLGSPERRQEMVRRGQELVDGAGAKRVAALLMKREAISTASFL
jgi:UDP-2,4-diacetamido-2,4,6-trideoxy-beta-L-altropyranose hydrolase